MGRFSGKIGFSIPNETSPGIFESDIVEKGPYYGNVIRSSRYNTTTDGENDMFNISNQISVIADEFIYSNLSRMKYIYYLGIKWKITNAEVARPRLLLTIGGVYNGPKTT